jgi:hypothetical protein
MENIILKIKEENRDKFARTDLVLERAQEVGFAEISPAEVAPEGYSCSDIFAVWYIRWWEKRHRHVIKENFYNYFKEIAETISDDFISLIRINAYSIALKILIRTILDWPLKIKYEGVVWVLDSLTKAMEHSAFDLANELLSDENSGDIISFYSKSNKLSKELLSTEEGRKKVFDHMTNQYNLVKVTEYMWVNSKNPTYIVVDESVVPFDMEKGWSSEMLAKVVSEWYGVFYGIFPVIKVY